jgi:hypothetical protein
MADEARWYRIGGYAAVALALGYVAITLAFIAAGAVPDGVEARLAYLAERTTLWWLILGVSVVTDLLFVPISIALYLALRDVDRPLALLGAGLLGLFVILDLAVTWPNYAALIVLGGQHASTADASQQVIEVAAATYPTAVLSSTLFAVYAILVPGLGILALGFVMLRATAFGRLAGSLGIATGLLAIVAVIGGAIVDGLGTLAILTSVLTTVWVLVSGIRLLRLGGA